MSKILCGWCHQPTPLGRCVHCEHSDPDLPWTQRGQKPPTVPDAAAGRPGLDEADIRRRYAEAKGQIRDAGQQPTAVRIASALDVSERTFRTWRERFDLR